MGCQTNISPYTPCDVVIPSCTCTCTTCIGVYKTKNKTICVSDGNGGYTCTTTTEVEQVPAVCRCVPCLTWYTAYHHLQAPFCTVGQILPPRFNVGVVAAIVSGAHQHFSLGDGSSFLDFGLQSICGQTLDISSWLPWPMVGTRSAVPGPLYYPPVFPGSLNQANAVAYIQSVFAPSIEGSGYVQFFGSTEHYKAEYYANDIYPNNDYPPSNNESMAGTPVYLAIANNAIASQVKSKVVFSGFINATVQYMVIVQHTSCTASGSITIL